jgi:hypothetical protein
MNIAKSRKGEMGYYTDIILAFDCEEFEDEDHRVPPPIVEINQWLLEHHRAELKQASSQTAFSDECFFRAFKNLNTKGFLDFVFGRAWKVPENVQVFKKGEDDEQFKCVTLAVHQCVVCGKWIGWKSDDSYCLDCRCRDWKCPFCKRECWPMWDCECGAKAVNSVFWAANGIPLMNKGLQILEMDSSSVN